MVCKFSNCTFIKVLETLRTFITSLVAFEAGWGREVLPIVSYNELYREASNEGGTFFRVVGW